MEPLKDITDYNRRVVLGPPFPPGDEMKFEALRISSFDRWPRGKHHMINRLAKAGFYQRGDQISDKVMCFSCKLEAEGWSDADDPFQVHTRKSSNCPFVQEQDGNLSTSASQTHEWKNSIKVKSGPPTTTSNSIGHRRDDRSVNPHLNEENPTFSAKVSPVINSEKSKPIPELVESSHHDEADTRPTSEPRWQRDSATQQGRGLKAGEAYGDQGYGSKACDTRLTDDRGMEPGRLLCKHPSPSNSPYEPREHPIMGSEYAELRKHTTREFLRQMKSEAERVKTYFDFPSTALLEPRTLAEAGFYYMGNKDRTKCAFCQGVLYNWQLSDDPLCEHRKHLPECPFIRGVEVGNIPVEKPPCNSLHRYYDIHRDCYNSGHAFQKPLEKPEQNFTGFTSSSTGSEPAYMASGPAMMAMDMGYSWDLVQKVIVDRLNTTGGNFPDCSSLMDAIFAMDEKENGQSPREQQNYASEKKRENTSPQDEYQSLVTQNEELKTRRLCKVCLATDADTLLLPCAHLACCRACAPRLGSPCPACKRTVHKAQHIYVA